MLTIFTIPKPFKGHIATIQRNAIQSWQLLRPRPEIILFGNEEGTAQVAAEFDLRHEPQIASNEYGTPLLDDLFRRAELKARAEILCYVNADILVPSDFARAVEHVTSQLDRFLIVSERINVGITEALAFQAGWEESLKTRCLESGTPTGPTGIDIFVFPKGTYPDVPDFGIGRLWFDQWLIKAARESNIPVVDLSRVAPLIHQSHDYTHVPGGEEWVWRGKEAEYNFRLYGAAPHAYTLFSVTHELTTNGRLRRVFLRPHRAAVKSFFWELFVNRTHQLRKRLGLSRSAHA